MEKRWHRSRQIAAACIAAAAIIALCFLHDRPAAKEPSRIQYPVRGIDVSAHNGDIDFAKAASDSIEFALIKATEGTSFKDPRFLSNYRKAKEAGIKVGAYHFFRFDVDGTMQALNIIHSIKRLDLDLPVAIDIEEWANPGDVSTGLILARLDSLVDHLFRSGFRVMLYSNKDGHHRFLKNRNPDLPLWICSIPDAPDAMDWNLWQYTHRGRVAGIKGAVDINVYNGSREAWERWIRPDTAAYPQHSSDAQ